MEIPDYGDRSKNLRYLYASVSNPSGRTGEESVGERAEEAKTLPSQSLSQSVSQSASRPTSQPANPPAFLQSTAKPNRHAGVCEYVRTVPYVGYRNAVLHLILAPPIVFAFSSNGSQPRLPRAPAMRRSFHPTFWSFVRFLCRGAGGGGYGGAKARRKKRQKGQGHTQSGKLSTGFPRCGTDGDQG